MRAVHMWSTQSCISSSLGLQQQHHILQQHVVPTAARTLAPLRQLLARSIHRHDDPGQRRFPVSEGLPLSLFHPFKRLPPEGTTLPLEEEICDPEEEKCKTPLHVYEAKCTACSGTGWARAPSNGRRGHLSTCMVCHGLGFVRRTTSRFCPDDPDKHMTIARPLTWNGKFAARVDSSLRHSTSSSSGSSSGSGNTGDNGSSNGNGSSSSPSSSSSSPSHSSQDGHGTTSRINPYTGVEVRPGSRAN